MSEAGQDRALSTAFTHDHFSASSHQHHGLYGGLVVEPAGSIWRDPETGALFGDRSDGGPTSYRADILFPGRPPEPVPRVQPEHRRLRPRLRRVRPAGEPVVAGAGAAAGGHHPWALHPGRDLVA